MKKQREDDINTIKKGLSPILYINRFIILLFLILHCFQPHFHHLWVDKNELLIGQAQRASTSAPRVKFVRKHQEVLKECR